MEFNSQIELYQKLYPVFNVKKKLNSITNYKDVSNNDIWLYLAKTKWSHSTNLTISEIVNDIIDVNIASVVKFKGESK